MVDFVVGSETFVLQISDTIPISDCPGGSAMNTRTAFLLTALIATFSGLEAYACGDSLYRVGRSVSYRTYSAPLPGNLLFYADSESARQLATELAESGHGVNMVDNPEELASELEKGGYDVVITPFSQLETVESTIDRIGESDASLLPIAANDEEEQQAEQSYGRALASTDSIKQYLRAIHRALKTRA